LLTFNVQDMTFWSMIFFWFFCYTRALVSRLIFHIHLINLVRFSNSFGKFVNLKSGQTLPRHRVLRSYHIAFLQSFHHFVVQIIIITLLECERDNLEYGFVWTSSQRMCRMRSRDSVVKQSRFLSPCWRTLLV